MLKLPDGPLVFVSAQMAVKFILFCHLLAAERTHLISRRSHSSSTQDLNDAGAADDLIGNINNSGEELHGNSKRLCGLLKPFVLGAVCQRCSSAGEIVKDEPHGQQQSGFLFFSSLDLS